jgi:hypothetical protein
MISSMCIPSFDVGSNDISAVYAVAAPNGTIPIALGGWAPAAPLQRFDADVTLLMLAQNAITYLAPSDDPWMPAHTEVPGNHAPSWFGDHDLNLMGCAEQYQICNPNILGDAGCTELNSAPTVLLQTGLPLLKMNDYQLQTATRFLETPFRSIYWTVQGRGASALNGKRLITRSDFLVQR